MASANLSIRPVTGMAGCRVVALLAASVVLLSSLPGFAESHTFTSKNGQKIDAELLSYDATRQSIKIRRTDGSLFDIAVANLSLDDQQHVTQWRMQQHPYAWKKLTIEISSDRERTDRVSSPGIYGAFGLTGNTWTGKLPPGAWVLIEIDEQEPGYHRPRALLQFTGGQSTWYLNYSEGIFYRKHSPPDKPVAVGVSCGAVTHFSTLIADQSEALREELLDNFRSRVENSTHPLSLDSAIGFTRSDLHPFRGRVAAVLFRQWLLGTDAIDYLTRLPAKAISWGLSGSSDRYLHLLDHRSDQLELLCFTDNLLSDNFADLLEAENFPNLRALKIESFRSGDRMPDFAELPRLKFLELEKVAGDIPAATIAIGQSRQLESLSLGSLTGAPLAIDTSVIQTPRLTALRIGSSGGGGLLKRNPNLTNLCLTPDIEREFTAAGADQFAYLRMIEAAEVSKPLVEALLTRRNPSSLQRVHTSDSGNIVDQLREQLPDLKILVPASPRP